MSLESSSGRFLDSILGAAGFPVCLTNSEIETCITTNTGVGSSEHGCLECIAQIQNSTWEACRNDAGLFNYLAFYYCGPLGKAGAAIVMLIWLAVLFYLLVPVTPHCSKRLHLSNNIIGLLFVAAGNGAPDLFSGFSAILHGSQIMGIATLVGGSLFIITVVWAMVTLLRPAHLPRRPFVRDIVFLLATAALFLVVVMDKTIVAWEAGLLVAGYFLYVAVVLVSRFISQRRKKKHREALGIIEDTGEDLFEMPDEPPQLDDILFVTNIRSWKGSKYGGYSGSLRFSSEQNSIKKYWYQFLGAIGWQEKSLPAKIFYILVGPATLMRNLTIPGVREGSWNKVFACLNPILAPLFVLAALGHFRVGIPFSSSFAFPLWAVVLIAGMVVACIIFFTTSPKDPPRIVAPFVVAAMLMSGFWVYVVSTELVGVLRTFCRIAGVGNEVVGLSLLAWGNSVSDLVTNSLLARQGWTDTAIAACLGGAAFNLLLGIGLSSLIRISIEHKPIPIDFEVSIVGAFFWMVVVALFSGITLPCLSFNTSKKHAVALLITYGLFFIFVILTETGVIPNHKL